MFQVRLAGERDDPIVGKLLRQQIAEAGLKFVTRNFSRRAGRIFRSQELQPVGTRAAQPRGLERQLARIFGSDGINAAHQIALRPPQMQQDHISLLAHLVAESLQRSQSRAVFTNSNAALGGDSLQPLAKPLGKLHGARV